MYYLEGKPKTNHVVHQYIDLCLGCCTGIHISCSCYGLSSDISSL